MKRAQVTAQVVTAVVEVQRVAGDILRVHREATSKARGRWVRREQGREWGRLVLRSWREVVDGGSVRSYGGRIRWHGETMGRTVVSGRGGQIRAGGAHAAAQVVVTGPDARAAALIEAAYGKAEPPEAM